MQCLKMFLVPILTPVLAFSSNTVLAQEVLVDTIPDFYFLEDDLESNGETINVYACREDSATERPSLNNKDFRTLGLDCFATIEVGRADLHQFVANLGLEMESLEKDFEKFNGQNWMGALIGASSFVVGALVGFDTIIEFIEGSRSREPMGYTLRSNKGKIFIVASSLVGIAIAANVIEFREHPYPIRKHLREQIRQGMVREMENNTKSREMFGLFTDFLNQHGTLLQTE